MEFLIGGADVNLRFVVADAADDISAEQITPEFPAGVSVHEANFATGPDKRRLFRRKGFSRRIIFAVFRIDHARDAGVTFFARVRTD